MKPTSKMPFLTQFALCACCSAFASERLLNEAVNHDQGLSGIQERFEELQSRQADSRVFSEEEMKDANSTIQSMETVREEQVADMILALGESVNLEDSETKRHLYQKVADDYNIAIDSLEKIVREQGSRVQEFAEKRELLETQKAILRDLEDVAEDIAETGEMDEETVDELARLAQEQEEAAAKSEVSDLGERMEDVAENMKEAEIEEAVQKSEELVAELEKELDELGASEDLMTSETARALEEAIDKVSDIREELGDTDDPMNNSERQDAAEDLNEVAQELESMEDSSQTDALESAMMDILSEMDASADQTLADVQEHLESQLAEALAPEAMEMPPLSAEELAEMLAQMEEMMSEMQAMTQTMEQSASGEAPLGEAERQEMAGAMQEMAEALPAAPAGPMDAAAQQTAAGMDAAAAQSLMQAQAQMASAMTQMQAQANSQMASMPPGSQSMDIPGMESGEEGEAFDGGFGDGSRNQEKKEDQWTARLPKKERSALRAARQARYSPHLEQDVNRYFVELAK